MEIKYSKSKFKAHALEIFRHIELTGETAVITDRGKPALIVKPYTPVQDDPQQTLKASVVRYDDPFAPVGEEDWESLA